jgi:formate C-acetyltransferase
LQDWVRAPARSTSPWTWLQTTSCPFTSLTPLQEYLKSCPKYGNDLEEPDAAAARIAHKVSEMVIQLRNPAGKPFLPDFSTPSTHLLYGYHVGATPDGRNAREMLGYGIDPRRESVHSGRIDQLLSERKLKFDDFCGGYASHLGISPEVFRQGKNIAEKMHIFSEKIIKPLFGFKEELENAPFYVYFNIDSKINLRKVLAEPEKYAPNGIYIMRIHGTFVNFLDLSPVIQQDIIARLDENEDIA